MEFIIPFKVVYKGATWDLTGITSSTIFSQFLIAAATKMNVSTLHLTQLGYIPLYKPKNPKPVPKMLEDEESWEILLDDVLDYIVSCKSKNHGKGAVKPFIVLLIDMSAPDGTGGKKVSLTIYISFYDFVVTRTIREKVWCYTCFACGSGEVEGGGDVESYWAETLL